MKLHKELSEGLNDATIRHCSEWAERYRIMKKPFPGPWTFKNHPWLLEMHDATDQVLVGKKAAQLGYTEWAINRAFYTLDVPKEDVLYVLPTTKDAGNFSSTRFDPALDLSDHIKNLFNDVNNVTLKKAGTNALYVRGSHSRSQLKSIPAPLLIFDEVDEMPEGMLDLAEYRASGQLAYTILCLSTPTIKGWGIDRQFELSSQDYYYFRCPHCNKYIRFICPDRLDRLEECSLVIVGDDPLGDEIRQSYFQCIECKGRIEHEEKPELLKPESRGGTGKFISTFGGREARGFHVNQMYSPAKAGTPHEFAKKILLAQSDETTAQEVYNSKFGECFEAKGSRVQTDQIEKLIRTYTKGPLSTTPGTIRTIGVDVGSVLHVVVKEFYDFRHQPGVTVNFLCKARILDEFESSGNVDDFNEVAMAIRDYQVKGVVVDAEPERRAALEFAQSHFGLIYLCDYVYTQKGRQLGVNFDDLRVTVNRTSWLDVALGRYKTGTVELPRNLSTTFKKHIKEPVRRTKYDKYGNPYSVYTNVNADHFAHADTYAEVALPIATRQFESEDIY